MAATSYSSLFPYIMVDADGAPAPIVTAMINQAARELCIKAKVWKGWQNVTLVTDTPDYALTPAVGSTVRGIIEAWIGTKEVTPTTEDYLQRVTPAQLSMPGEPSRYYLTNDNKIYFLPKPTSADAGKIVRVRASFVPELEGSSIPAELIERHAETLVAGAKAKLLMMANKSWTNPQLAAFNDSIFKDAVDKARIEEAMSRTSADLTVTPRPFGALGRIK